MKRRSYKQVKAECWKVFSQWVRLSNADEGGTVECFTCGRLMFHTEAQAGHFVGGRGNAVLFHEDIVHPQCPACNVFMHGNYQAYTLKMIDRYGREKTEELLALKRATVKFTRADLEDKIALYKERLEKLQ